MKNKINSIFKSRLSISIFSWFYNNSTIFGNNSETDNSVIISDYSAIENDFQMVGKDINWAIQNFNLTLPEPQKNARTTKYLNVKK